VAEKHLFRTFFIPSRENRWCGLHDLKVATFKRREGFVLTLLLHRESRWCGLDDLRVATFKRSMFPFHGCEGFVLILLHRESSWCGLHDS
jgi:hypothetical protein